MRISDWSSDVCSSDLELGFYGYCQPEHHLQIEGFEANNHPGMFSLFVGQHSKRMKAGIMGYTMTTHNPVRVAEEIATLDHMLQGRLYCGFTRGDRKSTRLNSSH